MKLKYKAKLTISYLWNFSRWAWKSIFSINSDNGVLSTVFDLKGGKKKPYLNIGSNGKYIRFAISQGETETDIKIREQTDSGTPTVAADPEGNIAQIYRGVARRAAVKVAELSKDHSSLFPDIVIQNT